MNLFLATHFNCFKAEWIKLKRTGIIWLCLGIAFFIPLLNTLIKYAFERENNPGQQGDWNSFIIESYQWFSGFFFPLFLVIVMLRLVYLEHRSDTWKLLQTQPIARSALFLVKYEVALLITLITLIGVLVFSLAGALVLKFTFPGTAYKSASVDWLMLLSFIARLWLATWGLLAIQYFISLAIRNFSWPMIIGLVAIIAGSFFRGFQVADWFPYGAPALTSATSEGTARGIWLLPHELLSIAWALLFLFLGYRFFVTRDAAKAYLKPAFTGVFTLAVLTLFVLLFWVINKPVVLERYGKTIIAGKIEANAVDKILIVSLPAMDTIMKAPVVNGKFHTSTERSVKMGLYLFKAGKNSFEFFFGPQDSLYLDISTSYGSTDVNFGGTRQAENEFLKNNQTQFYSLTNFTHNYTPGGYVSEVIREWQAGIKKMNRFKATGNIRPAADFLYIQKKLLAARLLSLLQVNYPRSFAIYHPNETLTYPPAINVVKKEVSIDNDTLANYPPYIQFVTDYIELKTSGSPNSDTATLYFIRDSITSSQLRNNVLYAIADKRLDFLKDSAKRSQWLATTLPLITNKNYQEQLKNRANKLNRMMKGQKAPAFVADALNGKQLALAQFANRYVVIDVWATWCAPCKREEPFFDELASRYTSPGVAFISLSIDEDRQAWEWQAASKSKKVVQLWAQDGGKQFSELYAVNSIPRFILIDPKGRIVNAQMPSPSDPEFESILESEIPGTFRMDF